jgi:hypothetical protein
MTVCALTLWQPWASLIAVGEGLAENGFVGYSCRIDHQMWAWPIDDLQPMTPPEPARGAQGFWRWRNVA